jgi:hypothetical protein
VSFEFGVGRERENMDILGLPLPCVFKAPGAWYGCTVRVHPARTRCSRLRFKAVDSVWSDGMVVSPCTDGRRSYRILTDILKFCLRNGMGTWYGLVCPYRRSLKLLFLRPNFQFFFPGLEMWYGHAVRADPTVPMVTKVTGTCELKNSCAIFHMPLYINITSKMTKDK